ncbi:polysaccharide deacetylase family protein [Imhoffiella purpurea]|uniref:Uricase (Urate oxidase) n=1 Tax=Imhoffiella purpurea TaxID=1249627 RepID=W9VSN9_9GAMM|nr:polysaccharide deacetylase family protein [Imhoffiella purpurea]EXJ13375.1 Uricase (urate oxidase) [Imhoffiella purpurea]
MDPWHPRDLRGYGRNPPHPRWPFGARIALQCVVNLEEGAERTILNGDDGSEDYLPELAGMRRRLGRRHYSAEGLFDYGARVGFWRLLRLFDERQIPFTAFASGRALELDPEAGAALGQLGHEVAGHGYRWIDYQDVDETTEREHIARTCRIIAETSGRQPVGWYTGRVSPNTRRLLVEQGGFLYDSDAYDDERPYWLTDGDRSHLVVPYSLVTNDIRYLLSPGCATAEDFFILLRDAFDMLRFEGRERPAMMSVGLHSRISGHPSRARAVARFLDYASGFDAVWFCRRQEIAEHWIAHFGQPHRDSSETP